ncbi:NADP-dependent oxidoreductase [Actinoplanes sp. RD1]|uniref:NADP-dependent oxidoreductase n=1 Tax=Actinoplanes sp. RD1 TaxID=3064538 RepID=UPI0027409E58|nr:NADP-dependent oxidoreductase [Actinoplanes sp. RD1]
MRALRITAFGPPDVLEVAEVPEPHPGPGQLRIAVRASGVTPADWKIRAGLLPGLPLPRLLGFDAAGIVDQIGPGVTGVAPGDEVFGATDIARLGGANAEFAVLVAWAAKPESWSWAQAGGAAGNLETATRVLDRLAVGAGTTLLVEGAAGGVGTLAVQLAVARGARVIGTASERNHAFLATLGAVPTTYGPGLADRVTGVDAALDCAGSGSLPDLLAIAGRVVTVADVGAGAHLSTSAGPNADPPAWHGLHTAAALADRGRLTVPLAGVFALEDAAAAHRLSESGHARGKIVLVP